MTFDISNSPNESSTKALGLSRCSKQKNKISVRTIGLHLSTPKKSEKTKITMSDIYSKIR
jgi:hypothetical protein